MRYALAGIVLVAGLGLWWWSGDDPARAKSREAGERSGSGPEAVPDGEPTDGDAPGKEAAATLTLRGRTLDVDKRPIAGVVVSLVDPEEGWPHAPGRSDEDGRFELTVPDHAWVYVRASHPEYVAATAWPRPRRGDEAVITLERGASMTVQVVDPSGAPLSGAKVAVSLERRWGAAGFPTWKELEEFGGGVTDATGRAAIGGVPLGEVRLYCDHPKFALHVGSARVQALAPFVHVVRLGDGALLEGRVLAASGAPVPEATVRPAGLPRPVATTDAEGRYRLERVSPGPVKLLAAAPGHGPGFYGSELGWGAPVPVTVRAGTKLSGLDIVLGAPTNITGRIVDANGKGVANMGIQAWGSYFGDVEDVKTGEDGRFTFGPVTVREAGTVTLSGYAEGYRVENQRGKLRPGRDTDFGTVKAVSRPTIRGRIRFPDGEEPVSVGFNMQPGGSTTFEEDGRFEIRPSRGGKISFRAVSYGERSWQSQLVELELKDGEVREGLELVLEESFKITGTVVSPEGRPRSGVVVACKPEGTGAKTVVNNAWSDPKGRFELGPMPAGRYVIGVVGSGSVWVRSNEAKFLAGATPKTVEAGAKNVTITFQGQGGFVTAKVVSARDGRPVRTGRLLFIRYKFFIPRGSTFSAWSGEDGRIEGDLAPGTWAVEFSADGFAPYRTGRLDVQKGKTLDLGTIKLGDPGRIEGVVVDAQGQPVPYARINVFNAKLQINADEPFTDIEGRFELGGISPDTYTVFAVSPRHPIGMVRGVKVRAGRTEDIAVRFLRSAPLTVVVVDPGGRPVPGAELAFTFPAIAPITSKLFRDRIPPGYGSHKADEAGLIRQHSLPPGKVTITIEADGFEPKTKKLRLREGEPNRIEIRLRRKR